MGPSSSAHTALIPWESYKISEMGTKCQLLESSHGSVPHVPFMGHRFHSGMTVPLPVLVTHIPTLLRLLIIAHHTSQLWRDLTADRLKASVSKKRCQALRAGCKAVVQKLFALRRFHGDESLISLK